MKTAAPPGQPGRNHACTAKAAERNSSRAQNPRTPTDPARQSAIASRVGQMPQSCRATYLKAARGKASPRAAIKAFCLECVGWNRQEVARCTATACPLWTYRPWKDQEQKERPAAATAGRDNRTPHAQEHGGSDNEQA